MTAQTGVARVRITYDAQARAAYVYLSDALWLVTRPITDTVLVDLDADGDVIGVELLDIDEPIVEHIDRERKRAARRRRSA